MDKEPECPNCAALITKDNQLADKCPACGKSFCDTCTAGIGMLCDDCELDERGLEEDD